MNPVREADAVFRTSMHEASERIEDAIHGTREKIALDVQKHPLRTVLLSVGAGLLIGMLFSLRRKRGED